MMMMLVVTGDVTLEELDENIIHYYCSGSGYSRLWVIAWLALCKLCEYNLMWSVASEHRYTGEVIESTIAHPVNANFGSVGLFEQCQRDVGGFYASFATSLRLLNYHEAAFFANKHRHPFVVIQVSYILEMEWVYWNLIDFITFIQWWQAIWKQGR